MKRIYIIAVIASVLAGISLFNFLLAVKNEAKVNFENVVVASMNIPEHIVITSEMVTIKQMPKDGIHPLAARKINDVVGLVSPNILVTGEQIMIPKLKKIGENKGGLSYAIPESMRAITVSVDNISGVAGFIRAGDRVDILCVIAVDSDGKGTQTSSMLLQNIQVLTVGKTLGPQAEDAKPGYTSVTLLVTPEDAVRLNLVTSTGAMRIILRGATDQGIKDIYPRTPNTVIGY